MRHTLEQLKAMTPKELCRMWWNGEFPFDHTEGCCNCLASHATHEVGCGISSHAEIIKNTHGLAPISFYFTREELDGALERYYALRLFYDHLYPQPTQEQIEQDHKEVLASAIQREKAAVEESFARMEENELEMRAGLQYGDE